MKKIMDAYADSSVQPQIIATHNAFKIILPNVNAVSKAVETSEETVQTVTPVSELKEEKILRFLGESQTITRKKVQELLGVSQASAGRVLKAMVERGTDRAAWRQPDDTV